MGYIIPKMGIKDIGLGEALFSKTRQRVFALLFGHPDRSFYLNEIVRFVGAGIGSVHREMERLQATGLVLTSRIGNQKHYQANAEAPIFHEIRGIVLKTFGVADPILEALEPLSSRIFAAFIYGSVASNSDTAESDIDLMIISDSIGFPELIQVLASAESDIGRSINPVIYRRDEWRKKASANGSFVQRVVKQPRIFLIGSDRDLTEPG